jgi:hypothetical protein
MISKEDASQADIDPDRHAYIDSEELGVEGYPVILGVVHHLHCLNILRMNLWYNIDYTRESCNDHYCLEPGKYGKQHIGMF